MGLQLWHGGSLVFLDNLLSIAEFVAQCKDLAAAAAGLVAVGVLELSPKWYPLPPMHFLHNLTNKGLTELSDFQDLENKGDNLQDLPNIGVTPSLELVSALGRTQA
jgi:hypothetical protein